MKVLITGGTGLIGKPTAARFLRNGWQVRVISLEPEFDLPGAEYAQCDIVDYDAVREQVRGCDAVVHLAAIRSPRVDPGQRVFGVNVTGTFNVFQAAAAEGIKRVVQASSINAIGCAWSLDDFVPHYLPIDEQHPLYTADPYSFSKEAIEDIGAYFWRREGISSVALRFPAVMERTYLQGEKFRRMRQTARALMDELLAMSDKDRRTRITSMRERVLAWRRTRPLEYGYQGPSLLFQNTETDPLWHIYAWDRFNFWAFIDVQDAALSIERGIVADYPGAQPLFVNDTENSIGYDSEKLARLFYPEMDQSRLKLSGSETLVSLNKARDLIGFEPEFPKEDRG